MAEQPFHLPRFVGRVYRRLVVLRMIEAAGVGVACGAGVGTLLLPVMSLRQMAALPVVLGLLAIGAAAGGVAMLLRRPRRLDTAIEADRQLELADLLSSAWLILRGGSYKSDPFAAAVLSIGEARAAALSPSLVVLNRLGGRSWCGIGLSAALVVTLALISANPIVTQADDAGRTAMAMNTARSDTDDAVNPTRSSRDASRIPPITADHPRDEEVGFNSARNSGPVSGDVGTASGNTQAADPAGAGGGSGNSSARQTDQLKLGTGGSRSSSTTGAVATGTGRGSDPAADVGTHAVDSTSGAGASSRTAPLWTSPAWPAARAAAGEAIRSGAVPAQYHALMRVYFDRE